MQFGVDEDEARAIEARAHALLEEGAVDAARALGDELLGMRWSGGFEIRARCQLKEGDARGAARTLEEATERVPRAHALWHLLGTVRSDLGELDGAIDALDRAIAIEDDIGARYNRAVARQRNGQPGEALADLEPILALPTPPGPIAEDVLSLAGTCLAELGRADDALAMVEDALAKCAATDPRRPRLHAEHAIALARVDRPGEARAAMARATEHGVATPGLLALARAWLVADAGPCARWQLVLSGPGVGELGGFFRVFDVVARDARDAFELAVPWCAADVRGALQVERCEPREPETELARGVHAVSARIWFGADS